jgi:hypothetical protein
VQLQRLRPALDPFDTTFATTLPGLGRDLDGARFFTVPDANRWGKLRAAWCAASVLWLLVRVRPDVVISTGALPGYFAVTFGKRVFRTRTVWVDSIANADELSMSGRMVGRWADVWLTQWDHLAAPNGPAYCGSVLA